MRNLKNYDEFMDFAADALEPIVRICADGDVAGALRGGNVLAAASVICRKHKDEAAAVLAAFEGITVEEFKSAFSPLEIPKKLTALLNSEEAKQFFGSAQTETTGAASSGNAQEATPE